MKDDTQSSSDIGTDWLDEFIENLPDEPKQAEIEEIISAAEKSGPIPLLENHGWPRRLVGALTPAVGGPWHAAFALGHEILSSGGIVILHGKRGTGKTRMAAEWAKARRFPNDNSAKTKLLPGQQPAEPTKTALYRTAMDIFLEIRATYQAKATETEKSVIEALARPGLLVIDELQERGGKPFEDRLITQLIDKRYGSMLPTILIANLTRDDLEAMLGPSILDRVSENGRRLEFTWDSYRQKTDLNL